VKSVIAEIMLITDDEIDVDLPFNSYGIDSLISMQLVKPFKDIVGYLPATILFEHPTVRRLSEHLLSEHAEALARHLGGTSGKRDEVVQEARAGATPREEVIVPALPSVEPGSVNRFVKEVICNVMRLELGEIDEQAPFKEYGIDSLISLELLKPLRDVFGYLPSTLLFEYPSVERLAEYLRQEFPEKARALSGPREMEARADEPVAARDEDIAIIGMAGRFPEARNCDELWQKLASGSACISDVPPERWDSEAHHNPNSPIGGGSYTRKGGFISDVDAFDNRFFGSTPIEAERMDPQERLFLQVAYDAMLDSGYPKSALAGSSTGVFVGVMNGAYAWHAVESEEVKPTSLFWSIANRVSYFFDLHGPSMAVDTACSSSLTALHLACQALKSGDCDVAIVGGVNLIVHPRQYELLCGMHMLSKTGECKPFGRGADGFVDGEGVCAVVIKRYADALRDRDRIHGVIRGSAINAGGFSNGYSAPNPTAQAEVIRKALERAGVAAASVGYVEAHGTGTELGDPIEVKGLSSAFSGVAPQTVPMGSIKGNTGHLESAAGLAALIKVLLQLQHRMLVPSIHCAEENPHLRLSESPFVVNRTYRPWPAIGGVRTAAVSSFGAGGANAHVIVQEHVHPEAPVADDARFHLVVFSARSAVSLQDQLDTTREWLGTHKVDLSALSYTTCCARDHFTYRAGFFVRTVKELHELLGRDLQDHRKLAPPADHGRASMDELVAKAREHRGRHCSELDELLGVYLQGASVPWSEVVEERKPISMPGYPFERKRFWIRSTLPQSGDGSASFKDHTILGKAIAPAALSLSTLYERRQYDHVENVTWRSVITSTNDVEVDLDGSGFASRSKDGSVTYLDGQFSLGRHERQPGTFHRALTDAPILSSAEIYRHFTDKGYVYGPAYQRLRWVKIGKGVVKGYIPPADERYKLSPSLLDAGLQAAILSPDLCNAAGTAEVTVPFHLQSFLINRLPKEEPVYCYCLSKDGARRGRSVTLDVHFVDMDSNVLMTMSGFLSLLMKRAEVWTWGEGLASGVLTRKARREPVALYELK
jgi:3-oxoacyl-(acyl-carrier-protein) synthase/acyl carrier protein